MLWAQRLIRAVRRVFCLFSALVLLGCAGAATRPVEADDPKPVPGPGSALEAPSWAESYGGEFQTETISEDERVVWQGLRDRHGLRCSTDPRLVAVAREHAELLAEEGRPKDSGGLDRVRFHHMRRGGYDYRISTVVARFEPDQESLEAVSEALAKRGGVRSRRATHCGLGVARGERRGYAVWLRTTRKLELLALPVRPGVFEELSIRARVLPGASGCVSAFWATPDGRVRELSRSRSGREPLFFARPQTPGRHDLELTFDVGRGPETEVLVQLFVDTEPPKRPVVAPHTDVRQGEREAEVALQRYIENARQRAEAGGLRRDPRLDALARRHSENMADNAYFGHVDPVKGSLSVRLKREGLSVKKAAENVAQSRSALRIHRNLMASPSHRIHVVDGDFTHVGIGVARSGDELIATQIFVKW